MAYDLEKGRLWVVCRSCRRWSLVPLDLRWETLEELEGLTAGKARLLSRTDHVSLYRAGGLEIIRIGAPGLEEEAWWRYGRALPERSPWARWMPPLIRRLRFGTFAWVGEKGCSECGQPFRELRLEEWKILIVRPTGGAFPDLSLTRGCPRCRDAQKGGLHLDGLEAELALARILAFQNQRGEARVTVQAAARLVRDPEGPKNLVRLLSRYGKPLSELQGMGLTALEILVNAARERTLMKLEAEALQAQWKGEEELASLLDGELSPVGRLRELVRRVRGG